MIEQIHRRWLAVLASGLLASLLVLVPGIATSAMPDQEANHADVVVQLGDDNTVSRRITFTTASISGIEALTRTDLDVVTADTDFGVAVCSIEGTGCPADDCFCDPSAFWNYVDWDEGAWQSYDVGAADSVVINGDVEGWAWGAFVSTPPSVSQAWLAAQAGLQWLRPQQLPDGSYPGFGGNTGATLDTILAVAAANGDVTEWRTEAGNSLLDYVREHAAEYAARNPASAGKLALGLAAADLDPRNFEGLDLVITMTNQYSTTTGAFGATNWDQAFSMLGWRAAGARVAVTATQLLADRANPDGGWGFMESSESDVDTTALAVQALMGAGQPATSTAIVGGLAYLESAQNADGGFAYAADSEDGNPSNTNSTAYSVQGLLAAMEDPLSATWTISDTNPVTYLMAQQMPDGGFAFIDPPSNLLATQQAVPALVGKPFPYLSRAVALRAALGWIAAQQQPDGSFAGFNPGATIDAVLAIVAAGRDPQQFESAEGNTPLDYLTTQTQSYAEQGASAAGKLTVGVVAADRDPTAFGGVDLVERLQQCYMPTNGQYGGGSTWDQAWAVLGLAAASESIPASAIGYLESIQATGGGWGFEAEADAADPDSTSLGLQALAATGVGRDNSAVVAGFDYLGRTQNAAGGFPGFGGDTSAGSTGLALQALAAYGEKPRSLTWTRTVTDGMASRLTLHTPLDAILGAQSLEGGFAGFSGANDPSATYQAVPGIAGQVFPPRTRAKLYLPLILGHGR